MPLKKSDYSISRFDIQKRPLVEEILGSGFVVVMIVKETKQLSGLFKPNKAYLAYASYDIFFLSAPSYLIAHPYIK